MIERYGLLTIISLGEIMLAISIGFGMLYGDNPQWSPASTALAALVMVFCLFGIYFGEDEHLSSREFSTALIWGYGHVLIFGSLAAIGAGVAAELDVVSHHSHVSQAVIAWWIGAPLALFFAALHLARDRHLPLGWRAPALPAMAVASLAAAALGLSCWAFAAVSFVALVWRMSMKRDGGVAVG